MASGNSIAGYPSTLRQNSLFQKDDDVESIDLNDGGALYGAESGAAGFDSNIPPCVVSIRKPQVVY